VIIQNKLRQKISWISSCYIEDYFNSYKNFVATSDFEMGFSDVPLLNMAEFTENNIFVEGTNDMILDRSTTVEDQKIDITRKFRPYSELKTDLPWIINVTSYYIIANDEIGKCIRNETALCSMVQDKFTWEKANKALENLAFHLSSVYSLRIRLTIPKPEDYNNIGPRAIVNVSISDSNTNYTFYYFPDDSVKIDFIGVNFLAKVGSKVGDGQDNWDEVQAKTSSMFHDCSIGLGYSGLGIISPKNTDDICKFFNVTPTTCSPNSIDPYFNNPCKDFTGSYDNVCIGSMLYGYGCDSNKICNYEKIDCSTIGGGECKNGACKPNSCKDLDKGDELEYYTKSSVIYDGGTLGDVCDGDVLKEAVCSDGYPTYEDVNCEKGCDDGACVSDCPPLICQKLKDLVLSKYDTKCGDPNYNKTADIDKDGDVDIDDVSSVLLACNNGALCQQWYDNITDPCPECPPLICQKLVDLIKSIGYDTKCGDPNYNKTADIDNNGIIDIFDTSSVGTQCGTDGTLCQQWYDDPINPCPVACGDNICSPGENCPADAVGCPDNVCYEPTCTNGCGEVFVPVGQKDETCNDTAGCASPPCGCNGSGSCVTITSCGNLICEPGEDCIICHKDCACSTDEKCCDIDGKGICCVDKLFPCPAGCPV
jgi:hypothetical protein